MVRKYWKLPIPESEINNRFYLELLAMDPHLDYIQDRREILLFSRQLDLAYRNAVLAQYLFGFLYQTASQKNLAARVASSDLDPSLRLDVLPE